MKIIKITIITLLALCAVSCDSYFDVELQDQATLEEMFSQKKMVRKLAAHMYAYLPKEENPVDANTEGGFSGRTDARQINASGYNNPVYNLRCSNYGPSTITNYTMWENYYKAIAHCTTVIENIHLDKEDSQVMRDYVMAEARFMRAFYYFCLFRTYGPVIVWGDKPAPMDVVAGNLDRNTLDDNINFIISELDKAIPYLPKQYEEVGMTKASDAGRATKGAALALKARVLLYAASPLYNGNKLYAGMTNHSGETLFPQSYDSQKWVVAKEACEDFFEEVGDLYSLVQAKKDTGDKWKNAFQAYQNIFFEQWNDETIWGWWMNFTTDWQGRSGGYVIAAGPRGINREGWQSLTPSFKLVDAYAMWETGRYPVKGYTKVSGMQDFSKPIIDEESGYVAEGFSMTTQYEAEWAGEFEAHNSTLGREPRYYACLVPNGYYWPCDPVGKTLAHPANKEKWDAEDMKCNFYRGSGSYCQYWDKDSQNNSFGFAWRRLYPANNPLDEAKDFQGIHYVYPAFRLAEMYFNYAECCIETGDYGTAVEYIDKIRERAGLVSLKVAYPGIESDPELVKWCFRHEKMIEFALEGPMHFYDNTRWMTAKENFNVLNWTLKMNNTPTDFYDSWTRTSTDFKLSGHAKFSDRDYLLPFDSGQLSEMTNLTQNYGF
ncbi:MAG: RagB/SusD family nutrient uptake outer membrane protein [Bacteroidales bacterium]|nr:RagB/SusD family nutrient uptake outer membrane protein [Bacteroidales bacterium]